MDDFSSNHEIDTHVATQSHSSSDSEIFSSPPTTVSANSPLSAEMKKQIKDSVNYNAALAGVSLMKVMTSGLTLAISTSQSTPHLNNFVTYMVLHDVIYILSLVLKIITIVRDKYTFAQRNNSNVPAQNNALPFRLPMGDNVIAISNEAENRSSVNFALATATKTVYYLLLIYGNILYFYPSWIYSDGDATTPAGKLLFFYMVCGYMYVGMPLIFAVGLPIFLLCVMVYMYFFSIGDQAPTNKEEIDKLPVIRYKECLPGDNECSICVMAYQKGEKIIQLKCSPMHHFHESCLKKWLAINGVCPVCRHRIYEVQQPGEIVDNAAANGIDNADMQ